MSCPCRSQDHRSGEELPPSTRTLSSTYGPERVWVRLVVLRVLLIVVAAFSERALSKIRVGVISLQPMLPTCPACFEEVRVVV